MRTSRNLLMGLIGVLGLFMISLTFTGSALAQITWSSGGSSAKAIGGFPKFNKEKVINADLDALILLIKDQAEASSPPCGPGTLDQRFVLSKDGNSVCDNTTGLWWQQSPSTTTFIWQDATDYCTNLTLSEKTWRLAKAKELGTLMEFREPDKINALNMPNGPFQNVQDGPYWSATTVAGISSNAWIAEFDIGLLKDANKFLLFLAWCVSGGENAH